MANEAQGTNSPLPKMEFASGCLNCAEWNILREYEWRALWPCSQPLGDSEGSLSLPDSVPSEKRKFRPDSEFLPETLRRQPLWAMRRENAPELS